MKRSPLAVLLTCGILSACGGGSSSSDNAPVDIATLDNEGLPVITDNNPLVLGDSDTLAIHAASIDFYRSAQDSCSDPEDSQYLSLSETFEQKTLLCVEFRTELRSWRNYTLHYTIDYPGSAIDFEDTYNGMQTTSNDNVNATNIVTTVTTVFATPELLGDLPQNIVASSGIYDLDGNVVPLTSSSLQLNGKLPSTDETSPEGTNISVTYSDDTIFVLTRHRNLPRDKAYCINHDRILVDSATRTRDREHVLAQVMTDTERGFHVAYVSLGDVAPGEYEARVYELSDDGELCLISGAEFAPAIAYQIRD